MFTIKLSAGAVFALGAVTGVILSVVGLFVAAIIVNRKGR